MRDVLKVFIDRAIARVVRRVHEHAADDGRTGLRERGRHDEHHGACRRRAQRDDAHERTGITTCRAYCHVTFLQCASVGDGSIACHARSKKWARA